jgi:hypothetical protein
MPATTELSTPPDMATTTRVSSGLLSKSSVFTVVAASLERSSMLPSGMTFFSKRRHALAI